MIDMACKAYDTDRRFHLNNGFDQLIANKVIRAYIEKYSQNSLRIVTSTYKDKITGFTTIPLIRDEVAENVLGVTEPSIVGKVSAYPLYRETLNILQSKSYRKYVGRVSTANAASLNLHFQLGARVIGIEDIYIWRKRNV
jgi:L-amino acid N-acyltransferase YncA